MRLVPFEPEHLDLIQNVWSDTAALKYTLERFPEYGKLMQAAGPAYSCFTDNWTYLSSCGFSSYPWSGSGDLWGVVDAAVRHYAFAWHRFVKSRINMEIERLGFRRTQTVVAAADTRALKWIRALGFTEPPALMRGFGPCGEDYFLCARIT